MGIKTSMNIAKFVFYFKYIIKVFRQWTNLKTTTLRVPLWCLGRIFQLFKITKRVPRGEGCPPPQPTRHANKTPCKLPQWAYFELERVNLVTRNVDILQKRDFHESRTRWREYTRKRENPTKSGKVNMSVNCPTSTRQYAVNQWTNLVHSQYSLFTVNIITVTPQYLIHSFAHTNFSDHCWLTLPLYHPQLHYDLGY